jgi:predicted GIY-YIG superfamily endonuclease
MQATGTYSVYQGVDVTEAIRYIGITSRQPSIRFAEHLSSNTAKSTLRYRVLDGAEGLTKTQARIWEQTLINQHGLPNLYNVRNSITPKNFQLYGIP